MASEFFEPAPEQSDIVLIESATLCEAEKMIESCEHCNSAATMPFEWILHRITDSDSKTITNSDLKTKLSTLLDEDLVRPPFWTHYVLEGPARCPNCRNEVLEKTLIEAVWFQDLLKLADLGDPQAQVNLGRLYHDGLGVPQDESEAMKWYRKAADQGDSDGQVSLGWSLTFGKGNRQDDAHAIELFHKAADHGNANAMLTLGSLYANGNRVTQNYIKAYMWYSLAVSVPSLLWKDEVTEARNELAALAAKMTTEEVEEAQRVARDWKPTAPK